MRFSILPPTKIIRLIKEKVGPIIKQNNFPLKLKLNESSRRGKTVIQHTGYDYVPTIMLDGNYRMWWCGDLDDQLQDHIYYSESKCLDGPWSIPKIVFSPTLDQMTFDANDTCDPSVIRIDGTYYMYYGGLAGSFGSTTRIGVATSKDGINWTRMNNGNPIIVPNGNVDHYPTRNYGSGQPSVTFVDDKIYLIYTDSTGKASNPINGAGQYVLRSTDPIFQTNVEELTEKGFVTIDSALNSTTEFSLVDAFSIDWQFVDILDAFLIVTHNTENETWLKIFNRDFQLMYHDAITCSPWSEGPGIVSRPDKHAVPSTSDPSVIPIDVFRSIGTSLDKWDLSYVGMDLETGMRSDKIPYNHLYEGCAIISTTDLPPAVIVDGLRVQFGSFDPINHLTKNFFNVSKDTFNRIPYGASMQLKARVLGVPEKPAAFVLDDDRLWPTDCIEIILANQSTIDYVHPEEYNKRVIEGKIGPALRCVS